MKIIVVGGDRFAEATAEVLIKEKHDVILVEKNDKRAEELATKLDALVLHGDGTSKDILEDADVKNVDALIAMSSDDKSNLMICELAKSYNVPNIISRINLSSNQKIFSDLGISRLIDTTTSVVSMFKKALEKPDFKLIGFTGGDKAEIIELKMNEKSDFTGKNIKDVEKGFIVCGIYRKGEFLLSSQKTKILAGDTLTICAPVEKIKDIEQSLKGS
jgi:trk system potassium uptake protein TrkA